MRSPDMSGGKPQDATTDELRYRLFRDATPDASFPRGKTRVKTGDRIGYVTEAGEHECQRTLRGSDPVVNFGGMRWMKY